MDTFSTKDILQIVALLFGFMSTIMAFISLHHPYWKESTNYGSAITTATIYENLWMSCATDSNTNNCYDFQSLLALPGRLWMLSFYHLYLYSNWKIKVKSQDYHNIVTGFLIFSISQFHYNT